MTFTIYEVIAHLVPGYILIFIIHSQIGIEIKDLGNLGVLALAYAIGFVIQTLSSWSEYILFFTWGGKPSSQLLKGKDMWKIHFHPWQEVRELLTIEAQESKVKISDDSLFEIAKRKVDAQKYERVISFNATYALSRAMTVSFLLSLIAGIYFGMANYKLTLVLLLSILVSWYRAKQRGFYYAKEVLNMYLTMSKLSP